jgi:exonuclease 3'-5' domain-containing protein 1
MFVHPAMATITVVETDSVLEEFLSRVESCTVVPPSLYFDLNGVGLGRTGTISIISVFVRQLNQVYLIDVFGECAFLATNSKKS